MPHGEWPEWLPVCHFFDVRDLHEDDFTLPSQMDKPLMIEHHPFGLMNNTSARSIQPLRRSMRNQPSLFFL